MGRCGETVEVADIHVVPGRIRNYLVVVGREFELQLGLSQRLEPGKLLGMVLVFVAAPEGGDGAVLGQLNHLLQALGLAEQRETAEETDQ